MRISRVTILALVLLLVGAPSAALACSLIQSEPLSPHIARTDLRVMHRHTSARGAWVRDAGWESFGLAIDQRVQLDGMRQPVQAAFAQQRSLRLVGTHPLNGRYFDDEDPATTCELSGKPVYAGPKVLVHETSRAIFVTMVLRRTPGSSAGCITASTSCDDITFRTITLDAAIGDRQLYSTTFG